VLLVLVVVVVVLLLTEGLYICVLFDYYSGLSCCSMHDKANICNHCDFSTSCFFTYEYHFTSHFASLACRVNQER
jgi:hypothetical protein